MRTYLIETVTFSCYITISEEIVIQADKSLKWAIGKSENILMGWLNKRIGSGKYKVIRQERIEGASK